MLVGLGLANPQAGTGKSMHLIGQGTGAVVTSEAVERLAYYNVPVDQVTYLDPHDCEQGSASDAAQQLSTYAQPPAAAGRCGTTLPLPTCISDPRQQWLFDAQRRRSRRAAHSRGI